MLEFILKPWHLIVMCLSSWMSHEQQDIIEYLKTENQVLREKLGNKRVLLNDNQRRRLAVAGKSLGRRLLGEFAGIVTPDTILRWHRERVVWRLLATENLRWGYRRIVGEFKKLGIRIGATTIRDILKEEGHFPEPHKATKKPPIPWTTFVHAHMDSIVSCDFFTKRVFTLGGIPMYSCLSILVPEKCFIVRAPIIPIPSG